jgi:hypothetical protein
MFVPPPFKPDLQRVCFYTVIEFLDHIFTESLLSSYYPNTYKGVLPDLYGLTSIQEIIMSLVTGMAGKLR